MRSQARDYVVPIQTVCIPAIIARLLACAALARLSCRPLHLLNMVAAFNRSAGTAHGSLSCKMSAQTLGQPSLHSSLYESARGLPAIMCILLRPPRSLPLLSGVTVSPAVQRRQPPTARRPPLLGRWGSPRGMCRP